LFNGNTSLDVYNQGAFVRSYSSMFMGCGGTIVSKVPLEVNFARNDILLSQCKVWRRVKSVIDKHAGNLTKKEVLSDSERFTLLHKLLKHEMYPSDLASARLIQDAKGKYSTLQMFGKSKLVCVIPENSTDRSIAERVIDDGLAFVVRQKFLDSLKVPTIEDLIRGLVEVLNAELGFQRSEFERLRNYRAKVAPLIRTRDLLLSLKVVPLKDVAEGINSGYELLEDAHLSDHQMALLKGLRAASNHLCKAWVLMGDDAKAIRENYGQHDWAQSRVPRKIVAGKSDTMEAWTDGSRYIAINIEVIKGTLNPSSARMGKTMGQLLSLLVHEYCHPTEDVDGHSHPPEFYERFHEFTMNGWRIEMARAALLKEYAKAVQQFGKMPNTYVLRAIKDDSSAIESVAAEASL